MSNVVKIWDPSLDDTLIVVINIDDVCNYLCSYCCNPPKGKEKFLDLNVLHSYVQALRDKTAKHIQLVLCGGEPTLHPDFKDFCSRSLAISNLSIQSFTNASQPASFYQDCKNVSWLMSYHHCSSTSRFQDLVRLLAQIDQHTVKAVNVMLDPASFDDCLAEYDELCNAFPDLNIVCNLLNTLTLDAANDFKKVGYTVDQLQKYEIRETARARPMLHTVDSSGNEHIVSSQREAFDSIAFNYKHWKCSAGETFLHIDVTGDVRKCSAQSNVLYNIYAVTSDQIKLQPCICQSAWCPTGYDLMKQRLFLNK